jgi:hypothetical protein
MPAAALLTSFLCNALQCVTLAQRVWPHRDIKLIGVGHHCCALGTGLLQVTTKLGVSCKDTYASGLWAVLKVLIVEPSTSGIEHERAARLLHSCGLGAAAAVQRLPSVSCSAADVHAGISCMFSYLA